MDRPSPDADNMRQPEDEPGGNDNELEQDRNREETYRRMNWDL
jgi:hypothetical protein